MSQLYVPNKSAPRSLDLFAGAGGLSLGFLLAGGNPLGSVDFDADSVKTFSKNFPMSKYNHHLSIEDWTPSKSESKVDVVIGGPPCQGFSLARGTRFVDDPRNKLYKHFVRIVSIIKPEWVVMENVEGILNIGSGEILSQILEDFSNVGYQLEYKVVNMAQHGVPQSRRRAIFVGHKAGKQFVWPEETHSKDGDLSEGLLFGGKRKLLAVNEALSDLNISYGQYFAHRANSQMRGPRNRIADDQPAFTLRVRGDEFAICENPATSSFIPEHRVDEPRTQIAPKNEFQEFMQILPNWAESPLLKTTRSARKLVSGSRYLTMREQARLQSFPDWFDFQGVKTSQSRQIGNAVPPVFGAKLFSAILNFK